MTNRRASRRRQHRQPYTPPQPGETMRAAVELACTETADPALIQEAKTVSHDRLLDRLGDRRRSGVRWMIYGPTTRGHALSVIADTGTPDDDLASVQTWFVAFPAGVLVIAMCDSVPA